MTVAIPCALVVAVALFEKEAVALCVELPWTFCEKVTVAPLNGRLPASAIFAGYSHLAAGDRWAGQTKATSRLYSEGRSRLNGR